MGTLIIRGCRYRDTRDGKEKTLIKTLGDYLYFSDETKVTVEELDKYFEIVNAS